MPRNFGELPGEDAGTLGVQPLQDCATYHASIPMREVVELGAIARRSPHASSVISGLSPQGTQLASFR